MAVTYGPALEAPRAPAVGLDLILGFHSNSPPERNDHDGSRRAEYTLHLLQIIGQGSFRLHLRPRPGHEL